MPDSLLDHSRGGKQPRTGIPTQSRSLRPSTSQLHRDERGAHEKTSARPSVPPNKPRSVEPRWFDHNPERDLEDLRWLVEQATEQYGEWTNPDDQRLCRDNRTRFEEQIQVISRGDKSAGFEHYGLVRRYARLAVALHDMLREEPQPDMTQIRCLKPLIGDAWSRLRKHDLHALRAAGLDICQSFRVRINVTY